MKNRALHNLIFAVLAVTMFCLGTTPSQARDQSGAELTPYLPEQSRISAYSYANLAELVTLICDDAMEQFAEFYGPTTVAVRPFKVIADYRVQRTTMLGITLADQMTAMINTYAVPEYPVEIRYPQKMEGVIEEVDGFLRVHINGRNVRGERRSYAVNVEMSEPIYRSLHSYAQSY